MIRFDNRRDLSIVLFIFYMFFIVTGLIGITIWNDLFASHKFDNALVGVALSMMLWTIMIMNGCYLLLSIIGLLSSFSTFIILRNFRWLHKYKTSQCYKFI